MNDTRIWSAAQMRALFPHKKTKRVHHLQAEDALKGGCVKCTIECGSAVHYTTANTIK